MIVPSKNQKTYGVLHTENYFSFLGFCKKVNSDEIQKVDVYLDDILIDTIIADKHLQRIEDIYELEGFGFEYILPNEYVGQKVLINFKNHDTQENLQNSPYELIKENHPKFNEASFLNSLESPIDKEKIKDIYCSNSIGFLAAEENLEDKEFIEYIKELIIKFPNVQFKGFCHNNEQKELFKNIFLEFKNINYSVTKSVYDLLANIEIYIFDFNDLRDRKLMFIIGNYCNNILYLNTHLKLNFKNMTLQNLDDKFKLDKDLVYTNPILLGFSNEEIENSKDSYHKLVYDKIFSRLHLDSIDLSCNAFQFHSIDTINLSLNHKEFKNYFINLKQKKIKFN
jgi:hypothetical protein